MKRISRRNFLKVAGVGAAALGLAACGGSSSSTASSAASSSAASAAVSVSSAAHTGADAPLIIAAVHTIAIIFFKISKLFGILLELFHIVS